MTYLKLKHRFKVSTLLCAIFKHLGEADPGIHMAVPAATHLQVEFVIIIADLKIELASAVHLARLSIIRRKTYNPVTKCK